MHRLSMAAAVAVLACAPSLARAGDAACLWGAVSQPHRDAFFAAYAQQGPPAANTLNADHGAAYAACKVSADKAWIADDALGSYALRLAAARTLQGAYGVDETQLTAAWYAVPAEDRQRFITSAIAFAAPSGATPGPAAGQPDHAAVLDMMRTLKLTDDAAADHLLIYLMGVVMATYDEARF